MSRWIVAVLVLGAMLSGCAEPAAPEPTDAGTSPATMAIIGLVQDATLAPLAGANVSVRFTDLSALTDVGGNFRFDGLVSSAYLVDVQADGFENATLTAEPGGNASLNFVLEILQSLKPRHLTTQFHGFWECALEVVIITPSCDSAVTFTGAPGVFNDTSVFFQDLNAGWSTLVVDVDFDPDANPGLDGMRLSVRGRGDSQELGSYDQYGRFYGAAPFTARLDPGQTYEEGVGPVPNNATSLELDLYPHSHGWHQVCGIPIFDCTLGVGVARNVVFEVYVTAFYNEPAPAGWSFLTQAAP